MINTLYEINTEYLKALENIEVNEDGEIVNIELIEELEGAFNDKAEAVALYIKGRDAMASAISEEIKVLQARKKACENRAEKLKDYLAGNLLLADKRNIETPKVKLSFRKSESVSVLDETLLADEYKRTEIKVSADKTAIKEALKAGKEVAGAELITKENLQIK